MVDGTVELPMLYQDHAAGPIFLKRKKKGGWARSRLNHMEKPSSFKLIFLNFLQGKSNKKKGVDTVWERKKAPTWWPFQHVDLTPFRP